MNNIDQRSSMNNWKNGKMRKKKKKKKPTLGVWVNCNRKKIVICCKYYFKNNLCMVKLSHAGYVTIFSLVIGKQKLRCNGQFGKFLKSKGQNMQLIAPRVGLWLTQIPRVCFYFGLERNCSETKLHLAC